MPSRVVMLSLPLVLVGCSSPSDVQNQHEIENAQYQSALAQANEWNAHVLGIPASGWLAIIITGSILTFSLLICMGVYAYNVQKRRAADQMVIKRMYSEERKAIAARPTCGMCGYTLTPVGVAQEMSKNARD